MLSSPVNRPLTLARLRHPNCHSGEETIAKALTGSYHDDYLFVLKQSMMMYDFFTDMIARVTPKSNAACRRLGHAMKSLSRAPAPPVLERKKRNSHGRRATATLANTLCASPALTSWPRHRPLQLPRADHPLPKSEPT